MMRSLAIEKKNERSERENSLAGRLRNRREKKKKISIRSYLIVAYLRKSRPKKRRRRHIPERK